MSDTERKNNTEEIDLVDFSVNREMDRIRENERIEREKRRRKVEQERRAEIRRRRKIEQIKQAVIAWGLVVVCVIALVLIVSGITSLFTDKTETEKVPSAGDDVTDAETALVNDFRASSGVVYGGGKAQSLQTMSEEMIVAPLSTEELVTHTSELHLLADAYYWNSGFGAVEDVKNYLRECQLFDNGYVYSSPDNKKSPVTNAYLYDTQASFINAVYEVCRWEANADFVDANMLSKLEKVAGYYMNKSDINGGGIRYNFRYYKEDNVWNVIDTDDGLVYICTDTNLGTPESNASNIFLSYKFGYLDCYNNLVFYDAMVSMSKIYDMKIKEIEAKETKTADDEANLQSYVAKRDEYAAIAESNKTAINSTFYDEEKGRYIGYINVNGQKYDYGFTAINLLAISLGVADEEKEKSIMDWINGKRKVEGDSIASTEITSGVLPVFSTVEVSGDSSWNTLGRYLRDDGFGSLWLYGGQSALSGVYNIVAAENYGGNDSVVHKLVGACENGVLKLSETQNSANEPVIHYALLASTLIREYFGVSTDGDTLRVNPKFSSYDNIGIKGVYYQNNHYDFLFDNNSVYILSEEKLPVKIKVGGFASGSSVTMTLVESERISFTKNLTADKDGFVSVIDKVGGSSYIKLESK